jgi:hypothetical protein
MLFIIALGASSNVVARNSKTINGKSDNITLNQYDGVILQEYGGNWIAMNPTVTV